MNSAPENSTEADAIPMEVINAPEVNEASAKIEVYNASLDLEHFFSVYSGVGLMNRLLFVARHSPPLAIEACRLAYSLVLKMESECHYTEILQLWAKAAEGLPDAEQPPPTDKDWIADFRKTSAMHEERLDTDLKHFKANSVKESIRRTFDEMGDIHLRCGRYQSAIKSYSRTRDYCASERVLMNMCLNLIKVCIHQGDFKIALTHVSRCSSIATHTSVSTAQRTSVHCLAGLVHLGLGKFAEAAKSFLLAILEDEWHLSDVLSASNVAIYGGLCALAEFCRSDLQKYVLSSSGFKMFLEFEAPIRDALVSFHQSKYSDCLRILEEMRPTLLLDIFLSKHVEKLYSMIRQRAIKQYFQPYKCVSLCKMSTAFNTTAERMEDEVVDMLLSGQIKGKVDTLAKVLHASNVNTRTEAFLQVATLSDDCDYAARLLVVHAAAVRHKVLVSGSAIDGDSSSLRSILS